MSWGLYLHVPWCSHRCPYCAFYVEVERQGAPWEAFAKSLSDEIHWRIERHGFEGPPSTIYLGGGTPSRMPLGVLDELLSSLPRAAGAEVTLEANPEDLNVEVLKGFHAAGVNRVSLGVQTFDAEHLRKLGRASTLPELRRALDALQNGPIDNWSADLMFALPGQTVESLDADLDALLAYQPPHVSLYGLTIEPDTSFERMRSEGRLAETEPETWRQLHDQLVHRLEAAGLHRYEISNFARTDRESRHNRMYWTDRPYLGAGPGAHGYAPNRTRWSNVADVLTWMDRADPTLFEEAYEPQRYASDLLISALRGVDGLPLDYLASRSGLRPRSAVVDQLVGAGLLMPTPGKLALTALGMPVADSVVRSLIEALEPAS